MVQQQKDVTSLQCLDQNVPHLLMIIFEYIIICS